MNVISASSENDLQGPRVEYLYKQGVIGSFVTIWNYGTEPATFISWKIDIEGLNGTRVLFGHRSGIIPILRPKDSQYMAPLTMPQSRHIFAFGFGRVQVTIKITCNNADYSITDTSNWILNGLVLVQDQMGH